jgi:hypothetical protein
MIEGCKRYRVLYGEIAIGDWETAQEAWEAYRRHDEVARPQIEPRRSRRYMFFDGLNEIDIIRFRYAVAAERSVAI